MKIVCDACATANLFPNTHDFPIILKAVAYERKACERSLQPKKHTPAHSTLARAKKVWHASRKHTPAHWTLARENKSGIGSMRLENTSLHTTSLQQVCALRANSKPLRNSLPLSRDW